MSNRQVFTHGAHTPSSVHGNTHICKTHRCVEEESWVTGTKVKGSRVEKKREWMGGQGNLVLVGDDADEGKSLSLWHLKLMQNVTSNQNILYIYERLLLKGT